MSDFDKFFAERLNQEAEFPRREKNWKALGKRLDAFYAGAGGAITTHLKYWQAAAAGLAVVSVALVWKLRSVQQENSALQKEVAALQAARETTPPVAAIPPGLQGQESVPFLAPQKQTGSPQPARQPDQDAAYSDSPVHHRPASEAKEANRPGRIFTIPSAKRSNLTAYTDKNTLAATPETPGPNTPAPDSTAGASALPPVTALPGTEAIAGALDLLPFAGSGLPKRLSVGQVDLPSAPVAPVTRPVIPPNPVRDRFRVGVQAVAATPLPADKGLSWLKGGGLNAEFSPLRSLWLTASADWLGASVQVKDSLRRHYLPPAPNKYPKPDHDLVQVDGNPRYQHVSLGLRYALPLRFWVQPSVRVAHTWVHRPPSVFSFKYVDYDPGPGPPKPVKTEYLAARTEDRWMSHIWQFGTVLEYTTARWVFRLSADYMQGGGATGPAFDALLVQTGVQYRF